MSPFRIYITLNSVRGVCRIARGNQVRFYRNVKVTSIERIIKLPGMIYHGEGLWFGEYHPWS